MTETLTLQRRVNAPPDEVWQAWTTKAGLESWWWKHWPGVRADVDLRVGGTWRIAATEQGVAVGGTYATLDAPHHLTTTWVWSDDDGDGPTEHVSVTCEPDGDATLVTVVHSQITDAEGAEYYRQGWTFTLDQLVEHLD